MYEKTSTENNTPSAQTKYRCWIKGSEAIDSETTREKSVMRHFFIIVIIVKMLVNKW